MRTILLTLLALIFIQATPEPESETVGIQFFQGTWEEALQKAKSENKTIFLDAYAAWCGPCKMLKRNVFSQQTVGDYFNKNFINVAMDMEKGTGPMLAQQLKVTAYPTLFFIDGDGKVVHKAVGYHNPEQLLALGASIQQ